MLFWLKIGLCVCVLLKGRPAGLEKWACKPSRFTAHAFPAAVYASYEPYGYSCRLPVSDPPWLRMSRISLDYRFPFVTHVDDSLHDRFPLMTIVELVTIVDCLSSALEYPPRLFTTATCMCAIACRRRSATQNVLLSQGTMLELTSHSPPKSHTSRTFPT